MVRAMKRSGVCAHYRIERNQMFQSAVQAAAQFYGSVTMPSSHPVTVPAMERDP